MPVVPLPLLPLLPVVPVPGPVPGPVMPTPAMRPSAPAVMVTPAATVPSSQAYSAQ